MFPSIAFSAATPRSHADAARAALVVLWLATGTSLAETSVPPPDRASTPSMPVPSADEPARLAAIRNAQPAQRATGQPLDLGPAVIRSAIVEADRDWSPSRGNAAVFGTAGAKAQARIDRRFAEASIDSCSGSGAFKFDPPVIGPIVFGGLFSFPWLAHAIATGRCKLSLVSPFADGAPARVVAPVSGSRPPDRAPFTDRIIGP